MPSDPTGNAAVKNIEQPRHLAPHLSPPARKKHGKRPPFDTKMEVTKLKGKPPKKVTEIVAGGSPKKMTKGLRRHLEKVRRQNPQEADRQMGMIG